MIYALIPARGGSKRILRKNVIHFAGKPMLQWTIDAATKSGLFDDVIVSTEDPEIGDIAASGGAKVLFRPLSISDDKSSLIEVVQHAISHLKEPEDICLLLANCPLRPASEIVRSEKVWCNLDAPALISVVNYSWTPPFRAQTCGVNEQLFPVMPEWINKKSQAYPDVFCPSGAIYWGKADLLMSASSLYIDDIRGFRMPWHLAIDIDTIEDLKLAECIHFSLSHGFDFGV